MQASLHQLTEQLSCRDLIGVYEELRSSFSENETISNSDLGIIVKAIPTHSATHWENVDFSSMMEKFVRDLVAQYPISSVGLVRLALKTVKTALVDYYLQCFPVVLSSEPVRNLLNTNTKAAVSFCNFMVMLTTKALKAHPLDRVYTFAHAITAPMLKVFTKGGLFSKLDNASAILVFRHLFDQEQVKNFFCNKVMLTSNPLSKVLTPIVKDFLLEQEDHEPFIAQWNRCARRSPKVAIAFAEMFFDCNITLPPDLLMNLIDRDFKTSSPSITPKFLCIVCSAHIEALYTVMEHLRSGKTEIVTIIVSALLKLVNIIDHDIIDIDRVFSILVECLNNKRLQIPNVLSQLSSVMAYLIEFVNIRRYDLSIVSDLVKTPSSRSAIMPLFSNPFAQYDVTEEMRELFRDIDTSSELAIFRSISTISNLHIDDTIHKLFDHPPRIFFTPQEKNIRDAYNCYLSIGLRCADIGLEPSQRFMNLFATALQRRKAFSSRLFERALFGNRTLVYFMMSQLLTLPNNKMLADSLVKVALRGSVLDDRELTYIVLYGLKCGVESDDISALWSKINDVVPFFLSATPKALNAFSSNDIPSRVLLPFMRQFNEIINPLVVALEDLSEYDKQLFKHDLNTVLDRNLCAAISAVDTELVELKEFVAKIKPQHQVNDDQWLLQEKNSRRLEVLEAAQHERDWLTNDDELESYDEARRVEADRKLVIDTSVTRLAFVLDTVVNMVSDISIAGGLEFSDMVTRLYSLHFLPAIVESTKAFLLALLAHCNVQGEAIVDVCWSVAGLERKNGYLSDYFDDRELVADAVDALVSICSPELVSLSFFILNLFVDENLTSTDEFDRIISWIFQGMMNGSTLMIPYFYKLVERAIDRCLPQQVQVLIQLSSEVTPQFDAVTKWRDVYTAETITNSDYFVEFVLCTLQVFPGIIEDVDVCVDVLILAADTRNTVLAPIADAVFASKCETLLNKNIIVPVAPIDSSMHDRVKSVIDGAETRIVQPFVRFNDLLQRNESHITDRVLEAVKMAWEMCKMHVSFKDLAYGLIVHYHVLWSSIFENPRNYSNPNTKKIKRSVRDLTRDQRLSTLRIIEELTKCNVSFDEVHDVVVFIMITVTQTVCDMHEPVTDVCTSIITNLIPSIAAENLVETIDFFHFFFDTVAAIMESYTKAKTHVGDNALGQVFLEKLRASEASYVNRVRVSIILMLASATCRLSLADNTETVLGSLAQLLDALRLPSESVQKSIAKSLQSILKTLKAKELAESHILQPLKLLIKSDEDLHIRRGACYGYAGVLRAFGVRSIKEYAFIDFFNELSLEKSPNMRESAIMLVGALSFLFNRVFEPYFLQVFSTVMQLHSDRNPSVRVVADGVLKVVMVKLSKNGVDQVLPDVLDQLSSVKWRLRTGSARMLAVLSYCAPNIIAKYLPSIVRSLCDLAVDTHDEVAKAAKEALSVVGSVVQSAEIVRHIEIVVNALSKPAVFIPKALDVLANTRFTTSLDAASVSLLMPIVKRGIEFKRSDVKNNAVRLISVIGVLCERDDILIYSDDLFKALMNNIVDAIPRVREITALAVGSLTKTLGFEHINPLRQWCETTMINADASLERSGAAQGLANILAALGINTLRAYSKRAYEMATDMRYPMETRDGYLYFWYHLSSAFRERFSEFVPQGLEVMMIAFSMPEPNLHRIAISIGESLIKRFGCSTPIPFAEVLIQGMTSEKVAIRSSTILVMAKFLRQLMDFKMAKKIQDWKEQSNDEDTITKKMGELNKLKAGSTEDVIYEQALGPLWVDVVAYMFYLRSDIADNVKQGAMSAWGNLIQNKGPTLRKYASSIVKRIASVLRQSVEFHLARFDYKGMNVDRLVSDIDAVMPDLVMTTRSAISDLCSILKMQAVDHVIKSVAEYCKSDAIEDKLTGLFLIQGICYGSVGALGAKSFELASHVKNFIMMDDYVLRLHVCQTYAAITHGFGPKCLDSTLNVILGGMSTDQETSTKVLTILSKFMPQMAKSLVPVFLTNLDLVAVRTIALFASISPVAISVHIQKILNTAIETLQESEQQAEMLTAIGVILERLDDSESILLGLKKNLEAPVAEKRNCTLQLMSVWLHGGVSIDVNSLLSLWFQLLDMLTTPEPNTHALIASVFEPLLKITNKQLVKEISSHLQDMYTKLVLEHSINVNTTDVILPGFANASVFEPLLKRALNFAGDSSATMIQMSLTLIRAIVRLVPADVLSDQLKLIIGCVVRELMKKQLSASESRYLAMMALKTIMNKYVFVSTTVQKRYSMVVTQFAQPLSLVLPFNVTDNAERVRNLAVEIFGDLSQFFVATAPIFTMLLRVLPTCPNDSSLVSFAQMVRLGLLKSRTVMLPTLKTVINIIHEGEFDDNELVCYNFVRIWQGVIKHLPENMIDEIQSFYSEMVHNDTQAQRIAFIFFASLLYSGKGNAYVSTVVQSCFPLLRDKTARVSLRVVALRTYIACIYASDNVTLISILEGSYDFVEDMTTDLKIDLLEGLCEIFTEEFIEERLMCDEAHVIAMLRVVLRIASTPRNIAKAAIGFLVGKCVRYNEEKEAYLNHLLSLNLMPQGEASKLSAYVNRYLSREAFSDPFTNEHCWLSHK
ncbi:hypothetical protein PCE1_000372 [Barthelona sp. PCE]